MPSTPTDPTKAQVWITGTAPNQQFEFYIPRGAKGEPGGITQGTLLTTGDLNDVKVSGVYRQDNGTNIALLKNYPENSGETGILVVHAVNTSFIEQQWYPSDAVRNGRVFWTRSYNYGVWRPWRAYPYTRIDNAAGRTIYTWDPANNRDQLIYGDTGARGIGDILLNGWVANSAAEVTVRRVGSTVTLNAKLGNSLATSDLMFTLPTGFKPRTQDIHIMTAASSAGAFRFARARWDGNLYVDYTGTGVTIYVAATWTTTDNWPTTLPGTAAGSIPNL